MNERQAMYATRMVEWRRCRDAVAGADAVKAAGTDYLPRLGGQGIVVRHVPGVGSWQVDEYEAYKQRANWFNASKAAVREILGALFRTPPLWDVPPEIEAQKPDITLAGESADSFVLRLATEVITVGLFGVLVDMPPETALPQPYWTGYCAEQILRVRYVLRDGLWVLGLVVLQETRCIEGRNEFEDAEETRYRVLQLDAQGYLVHRLFLEMDGQTEPVEQAIVYPNLRNQRFREIPFVFFGPKSLSPEPDSSPILDLVDINYSHYRTSADLEEGLHKLAVPTPYAAGFETDLELRLGANVAYQSSNPQAKIAFAEFSGSGLGELRTALEHKEHQMQTMRGALMSVQKGGVESAEAYRLRTAPEQNVLMSLSSTLSQGLTQVLTYHAQGLGLRGAAPRVQINNDFLDATVSPQEMAELRTTKQAGLMSWDTYFWNMQRGERIPPGRTADEEMALIEAETPLVDNIDIADEPESPEANAA